MMKKRTKLFRNKLPYEDNERTRALLTEAMRENCQFHNEHCSEYRKILQYFHFAPASITSYASLESIPVLPTLLFKKHRLFSLPEPKILIKATSSGTKGSFSQIGFEFSGLWCGLKMAIKIGKHRNLFSLVPTHYIMLGYKPHKGNQTVITKTAFASSFYAPAISRTFALQYRDGAYVPDLTTVIESIKKHSNSFFPMRLIGFPAYLYFILQSMDEQGLQLQLRPGSKILLGGGWKQFTSEQVEKEQLYDLAKKVLGIDASSIKEFYGAVEHPVIYCDCNHHHFHVPVYSRVIIRDVNTLKPLKNGEVGLLNLLTPILKATPVVSIMTDDLAIMHDGKDCGCGINSPYFEILGRVGLTDIKTCATTASDLMKGEKQ